MKQFSLRTQAFTLTEVMVSIAIVATLFAIVLPVMASAKQSAKETNCTVNLKNAMVAVNLYRADYEVSIPGSKPSEMGLPLAPLKELLVQKCSDHPKLGWPYIQLWQIMEGDRAWSKTVADLGGSLPMIVDINHRNEGKPLHSPYFPKYGILIHLDTHVSRTTARGEVYSPLAWAKK